MRSHLVCTVIAGAFIASSADRVCLAGERCFLDRVDSIESPAVGFLGNLVSMSGDQVIIRAGGNQPIAPGDPVAFVYSYNERNGWFEEDQLVLKDEVDENSLAGMRIALDGDTAVMAFTQGELSQRVFVFIETLDTWQLTQELTRPKNLPEGHFFGNEIAIDDGVIVVANRLPVFPSPLENWAYVYRQMANDTFQLEAGLPVDTERIYPLAAFQHVEIDIEGNHILVGSPYGDLSYKDPISPGGKFGVIYPFRLLDEGWIPSQPIQSFVPTSGTGFGTAIEISRDYAAVLAPNADNLTGTLNILQWDGDVWTHQQRITLLEEVPSPLGNHLSFVDDTIVVSALASAYVFELKDGTFVEHHKIRSHINALAVVGTNGSQVLVNNAVYRPGLDCGDVTVVSSTPFHGIDPAVPQIHDQIDLVFSGRPYPRELFTLSGSDLETPKIVSVGTNLHDTNRTTLRLSDPLKIGHCYELAYDFGGHLRIRLFFATLPGDVDGNGSVSPVDIVHLIDGLNGSMELPTERCDVDRSGVCNPGDILKLIDLLNGAGEFLPWNGTQLPSTCW